LIIAVSLVDQTGRGIRFAHSITGQAIAKGAIEQRNWHHLKLVSVRGFLAIVAHPHAIINTTARTSRGISIARINHT
jgi:hypothetical protein